MNERGSDPATERVTLHVPHLHCAACRTGIVTALERLDGVRTTTIDPVRQLAQVVFDPAAVDQAGVAECLARAGYPPPTPIS